jgi:predicted AlkP superfamily phosphohydrolase/phosphomutase
MTKNKLLVIGIDGGTLDIILPMVQDGKLPNLSELLQNGAYGTLLSTIPPVTAPAWSSFITGTNPGQHGVFYFFKRKKDNYSVGGRKVLMNLEHIHGIPFWKILNQYRKKVALINIPLTYPPQEVNGFMISGMLVPQGEKNFTYPRELFFKLEKYCVDIDGLMDENKWRVKDLIAKDPKDFIKRVYHLSRTRANNSLKLMKSEKWDLFMVVFTGSDRICHFFWEDRDEGIYPSSVIRDYYVFLDSLIGDLVNEAGVNTAKLVMSDHGFGPAPKKKINIFALSKQLGVDMRNFTFWQRYLKNRFLSKVGISKKEELIDLLMLLKPKIFLMPMYANFLGIRINHRNSGMMTKQIIHRLQRMRDPDTGAKIVCRVFTRESLYHGPFASEAPDLVVQFSYNYLLWFNTLSDKLISESMEEVKTGEHRIEGLFIASGPQIQSGKLEQNLYIQDVTSTILYLLNTPIPQKYDGRIITELFSDAHLNQNAPRHKAMEVKNSLDPDKLKDSKQHEFEKSKKLLEDLGYL